MKITFVLNRMSNIRGLTWPAWDSEPGLQPKPPSKFMQDKMNCTALSTFIVSILPWEQREDQESGYPGLHTQFIKYIKLKQMQSNTTVPFVMVIIFILCRNFFKDALIQVYGHFEECSRSHNIPIMQV